MSDKQQLSPLENSQECLLDKMLLVRGSYFRGVVDTHTYLQGCLSFLGTSRPIRVWSDTYVSSKCWLSKLLCPTTFITPYFSQASRSKRRSSIVKLLTQLTWINESSSLPSGPRQWLLWSFNSSHTRHTVRPVVTGLWMSFANTFLRISHSRRLKSWRSKFILSVK